MRIDDAAYPVPDEWQAHMYLRVVTVPGFKVDVVGGEPWLVRAMATTTAVHRYMPVDQRAVTDGLTGTLLRRCHRVVVENLGP